MTSGTWMEVSWPWTAHTTDAPRPTPRRFPARSVTARRAGDRGARVDGSAWKRRARKLATRGEQVAGTAMARAEAMGDADGMTG